MSEEVEEVKETEEVKEVKEGEDVTYEEAKFYEGFLSKKSKNLMSTWQKRYFHVLEGKVMIYSEKKDSSEIKGQFNLEQISFPESVDERIFKFRLEEREFILKAKTEKEKDKWIKVITLLKEKLLEMRREQEDKIERLDSFTRKRELSTKSNVSTERHSSTTISKTASKKNKLTNAGKVTAEIIKKHGFGVSKEEKLSSDLLKSKGIDQLINLTDSKIASRIYYGFINKKHKEYDYYQKRWFFIFSSRPLFDNNYLEDDTDLDPKKQKDWLKFDTLFYFKYESTDENSKSSGELELVNSHKIELLDKDDKFYLYLDIEDRKFDLYCDSKADRDIWFEVLKNSRRTAKEYQVSVTKHPRNIELLNTFFILGDKDFNKKLEKEKTAIVGNYNETEDFDSFEFNQKNLGDLIESTLDGCISNSPPKIDLLKAYGEQMNKEYFEIIKSFWDRRYQEINTSEILSLSVMLFNMGDRLHALNVDDPNFYKNGKELTKIYIKKTYNNVLSVIESILKDEREIKALKDENGNYYTKGPNDLFELLASTFELMKEEKNKYLYESILNLYHSSIQQYLLGVETTLTNLDVIIDKEFLLAMANNSLIMIKLLNNLLEETKEKNVLTEKEINENIKLENIMTIINRISQKSITTFIYCFVNQLGQYFKNIAFIKLDLSKILIYTNEIFGPYREYMNSLVLKKAWNEILKLTLYHYVHLLLTSKLNQAKVEEIREKIKVDIGLLNETYEGLVGKNLTVSTIKILNDIHDFLDVSPYMISSSCLTLRQYVGPAFNLNLAKALIKLRSDFSVDDMNDAIEQCKEVLDKYHEDNKEDEESMNYFKIIEKEMKRQAEEERILKRNKTLTGHENTSGPQPKEEEEEDYFDDGEENKNNEGGSFNIDDFINDDNEEEEKDDLENIESIRYQEEDKDVGQEEISDITYEGYMEKKTHTTWQSRYFQVKNGYLYWFKDKNSPLVQNKISIKNTLKVESHKDKKFMMVVSFSAGDKNDEDDGEKSKEFDGKVYKFACPTDEEKNNWVAAITKEMKRLKKFEEKSKGYKLEIPTRKKIIKDYFDYPIVNKDINYMRKRVLEEMSRENFFKPSRRKMEAMKRKQLRNEREQVQKDIQSGKDVGITDKFKFWFNGIKSNLNDMLK